MDMPLVQCQDYPRHWKPHNLKRNMRGMRLFAPLQVSDVGWQPCFNCQAPTTKRKQRLHSLHSCSLYVCGSVSCVVRCPLSPGHLGMHACRGEICSNNGKVQIPPLQPVHEVRLQQMILHRQEFSAFLRNSPRIRPTGPRKCKISSRQWFD